MKFDISIKTVLIALRRARRKKGHCDPSKKPWAKGPGQNVRNRKASGYAGVSLFPSF